MKQSTIQFSVYGPCIAKRCGRFTTQLPEKQIKLIEKIADRIYNTKEKPKNTTMLAVDLASRKISFDTKHTRILQLDKDGDFQYSIEKMVDVVGYQVRKKVRNLFGLHGKLWIARYSKVSII